ncbi:MAG: BatD family protein [Candidatus Omnitrophota bacterium]|nr:BatD family protein [Candidatus Omnitrophota bacterium]
MRYSKIIILILTLACVTAGLIYAEDVKFEASIDKKAVAIGETAQLGLTFYGTQNVPAPDIGNIEGCDVRYLGPSTMMTVINGNVSSSITHMYKIQPLRMGKFQFGPFSFKYEGNTYTSNSAFLTVSEEKPRQDLKEEAKSAGSGEDVVDSLDLKDRLFLTLKAEKTRAYVNEIIPVTIKFYGNNLNISDIQLPTFSQEGFSKAQFEEPKQYRERMGGMLFDVLEFKTTIFGTRAGDYKIGPAKLKCNLVVRKRTRQASALNDDFLNEPGPQGQYFDEFFTRYERYPVELKSDEVQVILSPLPAEGMPSDFSGAIGDYQFIFQAGPKKVKVGDPVTLKMEINGIGNFNTVIIPKLDNTEGFRIYEPQAKTEASRKTFKQILIPESDKVYQTPKAVFTYFDPNKKEYKSIVQGPVPLVVEKVKDAPAQVIGAPQGLPSPATPINFGMPEERKEEPQGDILYIKESIGRVRTKDYRIYNNIVFLLVFAMPMVFLTALYIVYARRNRLIRDTRYAHRTQAFKNMRYEFFKLKHHLKSNDAKGFYETLFKTMQNYLGGKLYLPVAGLTFDTVEPILKSKDADTQIVNKIRGIFEMCDRAKFALSNIDEFKMKDDMKELEEIIRYFERVKL